MNRTRLLLARDGGDRATAYVMSNKIVRLRDRYLCTWLDSGRRNQWAVVDPAAAAVVQRGPIGDPRVDNHCGAALATEAGGIVHLMIGDHHGQFIHGQTAPDAVQWQLVEPALGHGATYPSLVCDADGTLHLAYRCRGLIPGQPYPYHLMYCRRPKGGAWTTPRPLVRVSVLEHTWLTNALEVAPDGRLHIVLSNTRKLSDSVYYYGASHIYSDDRGDTWRQFGKPQTLETPATASDLALIEAGALQPERTHTPTHPSQPTTGGPMSYYYNEILLSNPVIDPAGRPWVIVHNVLKRDAQLYRAEDGRWIPTPLLAAVKAVLPDFGIAHCGQLARHADGTLEAVLMVTHKDSPGAWGALDTELVRLLIDADGQPRNSELVAEMNPNVPNWLPSVERSPRKQPALLYTHGLNSGKNKNDLTTEVWLDMPSVVAQ
ncbi:MAG: hypothetical protein FJ278_17400 [Planctomycetes bacterium]|nr:hypothetical protein [Planctomycetota bacterium]